MVSLKALTYVGRRQVVSSIGETSSSFVITKQHRTPGWDNSATEFKGIVTFEKDRNFQRGRGVFQESAGACAKAEKWQCTKHSKFLESVLVNNK